MKVNGCGDDPKVEITSVFGNHRRKIFVCFDSPFCKAASRTDLAEAGERGIARGNNPDKSACLKCFKYPVVRGTKSANADNTGSKRTFHGCRSSFPTEDRPGKSRLREICRKEPPTDLPSFCEAKIF
jgi:hypothetical protein